MSRIGADPNSALSQWRLHGVPVMSVLLGSSAGAVLPIVAQSPVLPPFGLIILLAWRLLHPTMWPMWIGVTLGACDDILTGAPLGSAMFLWSLVLIGVEVVDRRIMWRDYWHDWLLVAVALALCILGGWLFAHLGGSRAPVTIVLPQILWSVLSYPLIVRVIARLDRWRISA